MFRKYRCFIFPFYLVQIDLAVLIISYPGEAYYIMPRPPHIRVFLFI